MVSPGLGVLTHHVRYLAQRFESSGLPKLADTSLSELA
jgi:hypothetical protein